jgi:hypothetical protein
LLRRIATARRNKEQYRKSTNDTDFRENAMQMLAGDPFMTIAP